MKDKGVENVNVKNVLLEMRNYRMGLIQTPEQLRFSYIAIIQGLKVDWDAKDNVSFNSSLSIDELIIRVIHELIFKALKMVKRKQVFDVRILRNIKLEIPKVAT